jgi:predicted nuclease of predicted toxin-antitoxin system
MARFYSNENFNLVVVDLLRSMKHDVLTTKDAGKDNQRIPDEDVLAFAHAENRIVITFNYQHFKRLHRLFPKHSGIIICTEDKDLPALAHRIHAAIEANSGKLENQLIRINRPNPSQKKD